MLRGLRKASSNWLGKTIMAVVMGVLIISFGLWGIADIFRGYGQSTLAKVGSTEISLNEFRQIYTDRLHQIGRQFGRPLTPDQARAFGFDRQILQQIIAEAALDEEGRRLGLGQSDDEIRRTILNDPTFQGVGGTFDPRQFQAIIRNAGYTEQRYVAEQQRVLLRRQITGAITAGLEPPKTMIEALTRFQNERRSIDFVRLDATQAGTIDPPSAEALAAFFEDRKAQFRAPEYRKIAFVVVTPEDLAKWTEVSDDDAQKLFEQRKESLSTPEKREVQRIVFPSVVEAQAARDRIAGGLSFDELAKERGLNAADVDLGLVTKSAILDAKVADAAFSLASGEVSQPVQGQFGIALVKAGKIEPGVEANYASVATELKKEIATARARNEVASLQNKMEDERAGGASVVESAQKVGLTAVTIDAVDRSGRLPNGQLAGNIPPGLDVVSQAFNSDIGVDNDAISFRNGYVWYDVLGITPSRERNLDEVRDQVEARWRSEQIADRLRAKAAEIVQKLEQGGKLTDEAATLGVKVETADGFKRNDQPAGVPSSAIETVFRTAKDGIGRSSTNGSEWIVFRVTDIVEPTVDFASDDIKKLKDALDRSLADEKVAQFVTKLESDIGTTVNQAAFAQATGANNQ